MPETKPKSKTIFSIAKEVNRQSSEILDYLKRVGVEVTTVMSKVDETAYRKVLGHFKTDVEDKEKHKQKLIEFKKKHDSIELTEIHEELEKEKAKKVKEAEDRKKRIEEEDRVKHDREQHLRKELDERKKMIEQKRLEIEKQKQKEEQDRIKAKQAKEEEEKRKTEKKEIKKQEVPEKPKPKEKEIPKEKETLKAKEIPQEKKPEKRFERRPEKRFERRPEKRFERKPETKPPVKPGTKPEKTPDKKYEHPKPKYGERYRPQRDRRQHPPVERTFEKVTIKDDFKKNLKGKQQGFKRTFGKPPITGPVDKKQTLPITQEERKRDIERKNKINKQKYSDGADAKRKKGKAVDAENLDIEIAEAIRETFSKMESTGLQTARSALRKRKRKERIEEEKKQMEEIQLKQKVLEVTEFLSTSELAALIGVDVNVLITKCIELGLMVSINQRLEKDTIILLADEFDMKVEFQQEFKVDLLADTDDRKETLKPRPPVVTVMGHVDHGKTSLLDYIRKTNVVSGEAGGITQHIGAYHIKVAKNKSITFLDTPGHEAFTAMRARGAQITDIVVLVVAADDSVMPQTVEAINHALAANVPIVIAINKIDKPNSDPMKIKTQLSEKGVLIEEWGGKYQSVEIAAKHGTNVDLLLDKILLEAELLELKANPDRTARGVVVEAQLDRGKGIVATVLVQKGTLKIGDPFVAGIYSGKVKAMFDERGKKIEKVKPSFPVQVLGFDGMPQAGDVFVALDSERDTREISTKRQQLRREQEFRQIRFATLDDISKQIKEGKQVNLKVIIKGDVDGSVEALSDSLLKLETSEVKVSVIHKGIGEISETDVLLAAASGAIIIGFSVRPNLKARKLASSELVDIRLHNIIYDVINEIKLALEGLLEPEKKEEVLATVEVRQTFKVPKIGLIAGCYVLDGKITRGNKVRLLREGLVIFDGSINTLKRFKDDVREVESGFECGLSLENYNDLKVGDIIESYKIVEIKRKLE